MVSIPCRTQGHIRARLDIEEKMRIKKCEGKEEHEMQEEEKTDKTEREE
jgi:hypothetical protein